jgi:hypothetical protein
MSDANQQCEGGNALIVQHCAVFGRRETQVRKFSVSPVRPYAQYDKSVTVYFVEPRKRNGAYFRFTSGSRYREILVDGLVVYDSRRDIPIDVEKFRETEMRFRADPAGRQFSVGIDGVKREFNPRIPKYRVRRLSRRSNDGCETLKH